MNNIKIFTRFLILCVNTYAFLLKTPKDVILIKGQRHILTCVTNYKSVYSNNYGILYWTFSVKNSIRNNYQDYKHIFNSYHILGDRDINYNEYFDVDISEQGLVGLIIKNASEKTAGVYICSENSNIVNFSFYHVSVTILLDSKPVLNEIKYNSNNSALCCEITYIGDIPPILKIHNEKNNITNLNKFYLSYNKTIVCVDIIKTNISEIYWCTVNPNINFIFQYRLPVWDDPNFSISSDKLILSNYVKSNNNMNKLYIIIVFLIISIISILLLIIGTFIIKKKKFSLRNYRIIYSNTRNSSILNQY